MLGGPRACPGVASTLYNHTSWSPLTASEQTAEARRLKWTPARYEILVPTWKTDHGRRGVCRRRASPSTRYLLDSWDREQSNPGCLAAAAYSYTPICLRYLMLPKEISRRWIGSVVTFRRRGVQRERKRERAKDKSQENLGAGKANTGGKEKKKRGKRNRNPERSLRRTRLEDKRGYTEKAKAARGEREKRTP